MIRQGVFSEFLTVSDINPFPFHKKKKQQQQQQEKIHSHLAAYFKKSPKGEKRK